ncbi:MAG: hypothetical protein GY754_09150 [bacterium]|nr:hypothetical protein [bacterium]
MFKKSLFVLLSVFLFLNTGCFSSGTVDTNTGKLFLDISMGNSKTLLPGIDMVPAEYVVSGVGPGGLQFSVSGESSSVELTELAFGDWTVTVDALNADGTVIARGSETVTIHTGETTTAAIVAAPLEGNGTLNLTLQWNSGDTDVPSIEAQLVDGSGTVRDLSFNINSAGNTGVFTDSAVPAGYYTLVVKLLDNSIYTMGAVEIVRIVADETTTGQLEFTEINKPGGNMLINITADMEEPVVVAMTDIPAVLADDSPAAVVTASVPGDVGTVTYAWYLNGELVYTGSTANPEYTIPVSTLKTGGVYRIDVAAVSSDGKRAGSVSDTFKAIVNNTPPAPPAPPVPNMDTELSASDGAEDDWFGSDTAISADGNTVVVGAYGDDDNGIDSGSIYVYKLNGSLWDETKITASDGTEGDRFGVAVAVSADGNMIVAGASMDDGKGAGSVYLYKWNGSLWSETKITASDGSIGDRFGVVVAVSADGNTVAAGAPFDDEPDYGADSVYFYRWNGSTWQETIVKPIGSSRYVIFGASLSVSADGNTVVVGVGGEMTSENSAYVYKWDGSNWNATKLTPSDQDWGSNFGAVISISGDGNTFIVGAPGRSYMEGSVYVYKWDGSSWNESKLILPDDSRDNNFGGSVSISMDGNTIISGCYEGPEHPVYFSSLFIHRWNGSLWSGVELRQYHGDPDNYFGCSVSVSSDGSTILVGAHGEDEKGSDSGVVYIYK